MQKAKLLEKKIQKEFLYKRKFISGPAEGESSIEFQASGSTDDANEYD